MNLNTILFLVFAGIASAVPRTDSRLADRELDKSALLESRTSSCPPPFVWDVGGVRVVYFITPCPVF